MKIKKLPLFLSLLFSAGIVLSACTKEQTPSGPDGPGEEKGEAYAAFRFNAKSATRGTPSPTEYGTEDENKIHQIWMLLYNTSGTLEYAYNLDATNYSGGSLVPFEGGDVSTNAYVSATEAEFVTVAKKVKNQHYQLVVIANPGHYRDYLTLFTNSPGNTDGSLEPTDPFYTLNNLLDVNGGEPDLNVDTFVSDYSTSDNRDPGFFMSNANGVIPVPSSALQATDILAEQTPVPISIDRALAKVIVNGASQDGGTPLYSTGGRIDDLQWTLIHLNNQSFLIRRFANYFASYSPGTNYTGEMETAGNSGDRYNTYAEDPNYSTHPSGDFYDDEGGFMPWNTWDEHQGMLEEHSWKYATENTLNFKSQNAERPARAVGDPWFYYVTHVYIKARILFDELMNSSDPLGDPSGDYYSFRLSGDDYVVFTHAQVIDWITQNSFPPMLVANYITEYTGYVDRNTGIYVAGPMSDAFFEQGQNTLKPSETKSYRSLAFLKDGINVYYLPIKHFAPNGDYRRTHYGHYGVVRNNVYRVTINSIKGPGTPTDNSGYISADISVNPWFKRDQGEDL